MRARLVAPAALIVAVAATAVTTATASTASTKTFNLRMTGRAENPVGDRGGRGTATITIKSSGSVCWKFSIKKIDGAPTAAHIHKGGTRKAGPVVIPFGTKYKAAGCTKASPALVKSIMSSPRSYYVNVHNVKHPAGALRSQL
jgi:Cu/Zn superoxide dismutase